MIQPLYAVCSIMQDYGLLLQLSIPGRIGDRGLDPDQDEDPGGGVLHFWIASKLG